MSSSTRRPTSGAGTPDRAGLVAFLGAFCLVLSLLEYMIPKPLPFMRLGIANLPILIAASFLDPSALLALALVKVVGMSLVSGTLFSYVAVFSFAGTVTAALVMWAALRLPRSMLSSIGASTLGALASNAAQLELARRFVFHEASRLVAPPFLAAGLATGIALGVFAELFREKSAWLVKIGAAPERVGSTRRNELDGAKNRRRSAVEPDTRPRRLEASKRAARRASWDRILSPDASALIGLALCVVFLFADPLPLRASMTAFFLGIALLSGARVSIAAAILTTAGIVAANLFIPVGRVIAEIGPLRIAENSLLEGLNKALLFEGLLFASKAFVRRGLRLPGRFGSILASAFETFDAIVERGRGLRPSSLVEDADALALAAWENRPERATPKGAAARDKRSDDGPDAFRAP